jgi:hypothetical protein
MTKVFNHAPEQNSRFNSFVIGTLLSAVGVLVGVLSFAPYSLI